MFFWLTHKEYGELWPRTSRQPSIVDIQILRAGQLVVLCVPAELTTMAGRRLREAVHARVRLPRTGCAACHLAARHELLPPSALALTPQ